MARTLSRPPSTTNLAGTCPSGAPRAPPGTCTGRRRTRSRAPSAGIGHRPGTRIRAGWLLLGVVSNPHQVKCRDNDNNNNNNLRPRQVVELNWMCWLEQVQVKLSRLQRAPARREQWPELRQGAPSTCGSAPAASSSSSWSLRWARRLWRRPRRSLGPCALMCALAKGCCCCEPAAAHYANWVSNFDSIIGGQVGAFATHR